MKEFDSRFRWIVVGVCLLPTAARLAVPGFEDWKGCLPLQQLGLGTLIAWAVSRSIERSGQAPSLLLDEAELVDPEALAAKLRAPADAVARVFSRRLSVAAREWPGQAGADTAARDRLRSRLARDLNRVLAAEPLHADPELADKAIARDLRALSAAHPRTFPALAINRWMLESAFPVEIATRLGPPPRTARERRRGPWAFASYLSSPRTWLARQRLTATLVATLALGSVLAWAAVRGRFSEFGGWLFLPLTLIGPWLYLGYGGRKGERIHHR